MKLHELNQRQIEAVISSSHDNLVLAGAGTGKTRVLTARVEYLLEHAINPENIVCFTFTNKAAYIMKYRLRDRLSQEVIDKLSISTFHSFMLAYIKPMMGYFGYKDEDITIISDSDKMYYINKIIDEVKPNFTNQELRKYISCIKNMVPVNLNSIEEEGYLQICYQKYNDLLVKSNVMDINDIVLYFYEILKKDNGFREMIQTYEHILVDECQDTNPIQYEILKLMRGNYNHLFMCGDDDQSIYSFRGSDPFLVKRFIDEYHPKQIILNQNYRSLPNIIKASSNLINNNNNRVYKEYKNVRKSDALVTVVKCNNNRHEAITICSIINQYISHGYDYKDIAILFRNNIISEHLIPYLLKYNIPHTKTKLNFLECEEIKFILNFYRFLLNPDNDLFLENVLKSNIMAFEPSEINKYKKEGKKYGISLLEAIKFHDEEETNPKYFLDKYYVLNYEFSCLSLLDFFDRLIHITGMKEYYFNKENGKNNIQRIEAFKEFLDTNEEGNPKVIASRIINNLILDLNKNDDDKNQVELMSIHQAKGLEFKIVLIPGMEEGILPSSKANTPMLMEEERRICYVAISRAQDNCILLTNKKRFLYGKERNQKESRFLLEIGGE